MTSKSPDVVVFDFDLTLTRWDTASRFFRWLLWRQPWRMVIVVLALPALVPLLLFPATRRLPVRSAVWVATFGHGMDGIARQADAHVQHFSAGPDSMLLPEAVDCLKAHLRAGDRVVIATGCLEPLARAVLVQAGLGAVPLVASRMRPWLGGLVSDRHCVGANKIPMLAEHGFQPPWAVVYTDHHHDLPLLRDSGRCCLVSPKADCLERIRATLVNEVELHSWR